MGLFVHSQCRVNKISCSWNRNNENIHVALIVKCGTEHAAGHKYCWTRANGTSSAKGLQALSSANGTSPTIHDDRFHGFVPDASILCLRLHYIILYIFGKGIQHFSPKTHFKITEIKILTIHWKHSKWRIETVKSTRRCQWLRWLKFWIPEATPIHLPREQRRHQAETGERLSHELILGENQLKYNAHIVTDKQTPFWVINSAGLHFGQSLV